MLAIFIPWPIWNKRESIQNTRFTSEKEKGDEENRLESFGFP